MIEWLAYAASTMKFQPKANAWVRLSTLHMWDYGISRGIECTLYRVLVQSTLSHASEAGTLAQATNAQAGAVLHGPVNFLI